MLRDLLKPLASLTLTVILLALSMVLIYAGTLAQVDTSIHQVQKTYFHSVWTWLPMQDLIPRFNSAPRWIPGKIPFPGGYIIGGMLLLNLLAAHSLRFKFSWKDLLLIPQGVLIWICFNQFQYATTAARWYLFAGLATAFVVLFLVTLFLTHTKRAGVIVIHMGLILLLVGEGISSKMQRETRMEITEGSYANYSYNIQKAELAIVDSSDPKTNKHIVIAPDALKDNRTIEDPRLPFKIKVERYYTNSQLINATRFPNQPFISDSDGSTWTAQEIPNVSGVQGGRVDSPSAIVSISKGGQELGKYLLSTVLVKGHDVKVDGKSYEVSLRFERDYKPYTLHLKDFSFDRYTGTNVPKNYSSDVVLEDPTRQERRERRISMNNPLRYAGETFFQSSFDERTERTTVLQVVSNPGAPAPYIAILIAAVGLMIHFGINLTNFLAKRDLTGSQLALGLVVTMGLLILASSAFVTGGLIGLIVFAVGLGISIVVIMVVRSGVSRAPALEGAGVMSGGAPAGFPVKNPHPATPKKVMPVREEKYEMAPASRFFSAAFLVPALLLGLFLVYVLSHAMVRPISKEFNLDGFAALPLSYEGRVQPFDSLARNALKVMRGRESAVAVTKKGAETVETTIKPVQWLLDVFARPDVARTHRVFVIDHPDVKALLTLNERQKYFSVDDIVPHFQKFSEVHQPLFNDRRAGKKDFSPYQSALLELGDRLSLYTSLDEYSRLHVVPPKNPQADPKSDWVTLGEVAQHNQQTGTRSDEVAAAFVSAVQAYTAQNAGEFNKQIATYENLVEKKVPAQATKAKFESWFNRFDPFTLAIATYVAVFVFAAMSWLGFSKPLSRSALWLLCLALVLHTFGLAARIYISGRPPVTNLASSAIFIGWGVVVFALCLEFIFRNGVGSVLGAAAGLPTLMIAYRLSLDGDTMKVLQAVLDTNIWLATHVICISLGYSATFLAGLIGMAYIVLGVFTSQLTPDNRKTLGRMMYGITCFAILFSFVGTILGGIWADQSWGRFWGWDPKENGAVLIVLANAIFLHARWSGLVKERGMANLALFGNIVTAWSWFGTNMLGVGLHSYGFMSAALFGLIGFIFSQLFFMGISLIPQQNWRSFEDTPPTSPTPPQTVAV